MERRWYVKHRQRRRMVWLGLVGWVGVFLMEDTFLLYFVSRGSRLVEKRGSVGLRGSWFIVAWSWCVSRFLRVSGVGFCHDSVAQIGRSLASVCRSDTADLTVCILGGLLLVRYA